MRFEPLLLELLLDQVHKFPHVGKFMHLYTPFQCTLPRTFTYRACPFSVHCLSFNALPAEIRTLICACWI